MLETLILCMALDYLTGMMAAGIFHKSKKVSRRRAGKQKWMERALPKGDFTTHCISVISDGSYCRNQFYLQCGNGGISCE